MAAAIGFGTGERRDDSDCGAGVGGCVGNRGPSDVSQGRQYSSGNAEYDEFFSEVHQLQVMLGKAPDRERAIRQQLSQALGIDGASRAEEIAAALSKRAGQLGKPPAKLKLELSGLEAKGSPTSVLTTMGSISDPKDKAVADAIASLLADPEWAASLGQAARRRVEAELTYDALAARLGEALDVHGAAP